jgi:hypothetical protein
MPVSQVEGAEGALLLTDYAGYVKRGDWGPALRQVGHDMAARVSSRLVVPPGVYKIASPVKWSLLKKAVSVVVQGVGSESVFWISTPHAEAAALTVFDTDAVVFRDVVFQGSNGVATDAFQALALVSCRTALLSNVQFFGLASQRAAGGAVVTAAQTDLLMWRCGFYGCTGSSTLGNPVVLLHKWLGAQLEHVCFASEGSLGGVDFDKVAQFGPAPSWLGIVDPVPEPSPIGGSPFDQGTVQIRDYRSDGGASSGITVDPLVTRIRHLVIEGAEIDGPSSGSTANVGISVTNTETVEIDDVRFGLAEDSSPQGIVLSNCGDVVLSGIETRKYGDGSDPVGYGQIVADSATRTVLVQRSPEMDTSQVAAGSLVVMTGLTPSLQPLPTGPTTARPVAPYVFAGGAFFDLTLNMPVFYVRGGWVDGAGQPA